LSGTAAVIVDQLSPELRGLLFKAASYSTFRLITASADRTSA
jgi:hypothetical protein